MEKDPVLQRSVEIETSSRRISCFGLDMLCVCVDKYSYCLYMSGELSQSHCVTRIVPAPLSVLMRNGGRTKKKEGRDKCSSHDSSDTTRGSRYASLGISSKSLCAEHI